MVDYYDNALFEAVDSALSLMDCDVGASECHGMLCGMACGVQQYDASVWLGHVTGYHEHVGLDDLGSGHALVQLYEETNAGLAAEDFSLQILLPPDDSLFVERTAALGQWCRGFLSGFGLTDLGDIGQLGDDCQGYLRDLQEIGRIQTFESDEDEDEYAFLEICEYARMGAMLLHEEALLINPADAHVGNVH